MNIVVPKIVFLIRGVNMEKILESLNVLIYVFLFLILSNFVYLLFLKSKISNSVWILFNSFFVLIGAVILLFNTGYLVDELNGEGNQFTFYSTLLMVVVFVISIPFAYENIKKSD